MSETITDIEMVPFNDELSEYFTAFNEAWLEKYFELEPIDREMLANPKQYIIDRGGYIFFAKVDGQVAGTFALIKLSDDLYELSKMAVAENYLGKNVGNRMMEYCMLQAGDLGAKKLVLYSNTKLLPAIHLYKKYGFKETPLDSSNYKRSNIKMERSIGNYE